MIPLSRGGSPGDAPLQLSRGSGDAAFFREKRRRRRIIWADAGSAIGAGPGSGALLALGAESVPEERARDAPGTPRAWNGSGRGCRRAVEAW